MEGKALQDILIKILRSELNETELDHTVKEQLTSEVISALFSLSKRHDLAHIVSASLYKNGVLEEKTKSPYYREEAISLYRYEQMRYAYEQICELFNQANIPYIPLKGSVIRPYYPKESMRTSCDIDILVKQESLDQAVTLLVQNGFRYDAKYYHDVSLLSPANIHLELHFNILESNKNLDAVLESVWDFAKPTETACYRLTSEFFIFHMFAHMSYHFLSGGCGLKSLMDIWVMKYKMGLVYESAKELLTRAGIYTFAEEISHLADVCFSGMDGNAFSDTLLFYIVSGGVYGSTENKVAVSKSESHSTVVYTVKKLFLPYRTMTTVYPILIKAPFLLPFCWIARIFKLSIPEKRKKALSELKVANHISDTETDSVKELLSRLGLQP